MKFNKKVLAGITAASLILGTAGIAGADTVRNDVVADGNGTITAGGSTTISYYLDQENANLEGTGGANNCNASSTNPVTVAITVPSGVTATPTSLSFTACAPNGTHQNAKPVTFSSSSAGQHSITHVVSGGTGVNRNQANWTLQVNAAAPTNTAPSVSVSGVTATSYDKGAVPAATCDVVDTEDGNSSFPAELSAVTGIHASDGIGSQTASCSYTDRGGLSATPASVTYTIVDPSAPAISSTLTPAAPDGNDGWYKGDVSLDWTVSEPQSLNSLQKTGCVDQHITDDQEAADYSCSATSAGGSAAEQTVTIKRDGTVPSISGDNVNNTTWRNTALSVDFIASDATSGLATADDRSFTLTASEDSTKDADGRITPTTDSKTVTDNAGNSSTRTLAALIDAIDPVAGFGSTGIQDGGSYFRGHVPAAPGGDCTDALSGIASCSVTPRSTDVGSHTLTVTAIDLAGNTDTATLTYTVKERTSAGYKSPVRLGDTVVNQVKGGSTVPLKFEVFENDGTTNTKLTNVSDLTFSVTTYKCDAADAGVPTETTAGSTVLRYDATDGHFIQNWKVPTTVGCYRANMAVANGPTVTAQFRVTK